MKWAKRSQTSIGCGEFIICRTRHSGADMFTLWRGAQAVSRHDTAAQAKAAAKEKAA